MLIAQEKLKKNIAEYILYMWQLEDLIRACKFDLTLIEKHIISEFKVDENTYQKIRDWYADLIEQMVNENIYEKGHLSSTMRYIKLLSELHNNLLREGKNLEYKLLIDKYKDSFDEFRLKSKTSKDVSDIELCFNALYATMLIRLQKKKISNETQQSVEGFSTIIKFLSFSLSKDYKYAI